MSGEHRTIREAPAVNLGRALVRRVALTGAIFLFVTWGVALADAAFLVTPTRLDFGEVELGTTSPEQVVTVTNVSASPLVFRGAGGTTRGDFGSSQNCEGRILGSGESCRYSYSFSPQVAGPVAGSTSGTVQGVPPSGGTPTPDQSFAFDFSGIGIAPGATRTRALLITPTRLEFGEIQVGRESPPQTVTLTNVGPDPLVVDPASGAPFTNSFDGASNCAGTTLAPGQSCQFFFVFTPKSLGPLSDASKGDVNGLPFAFDLGGTGIAAAPAVIPFAEFIVLEARTGPRAFSLAVLLRLGAGSGDIDPTAEVVSLKVGSSSMSIPPGSFRRLRSGAFSFSSAALTVEIRPLGGAHYALSTTANGVAIGTDPVDVSLTIGDDGGNSAPVRFVVARR